MAIDKSDTLTMQLPLGTHLDLLFAEDRATTEEKDYLHKVVIPGTRLRYWPNTPEDRDYYDLVVILRPVADSGMSNLMLLNPLTNRIAVYGAQVVSNYSGAPLFKFRNAIREAEIHEFLRGGWRSTATSLTDKRAELEQLLEANSILVIVGQEKGQ